MITQKFIEKLAYQIMGCAIEVHKHLGAGLLESVYHACLMHELGLQGFDAREQVAVPIIYKDVETRDPLRLDILVNDLIIVEVKSVSELLPIHFAQTISYLKLAKKPKALLINFNSVRLTESSRPFVDRIFADLPKD
jgi:GxxExxY protein